MTLPKPSTIPLNEQITELTRELKLRGRLYPGFVERGKLTQTNADTQMAALSAAIATLEWLELHRDTIVQAVRNERSASK
jgi:glutathionylspermidine synthase